MTVRGGGDPMDSMAYHAVTENGSAASELRCRCAWLHHGSGPRAHRIQGCGAIDPRPKASSPLIAIPTAPSVPSCSKLSRYGLARAEHATSTAKRKLGTHFEFASGPRPFPKDRAGPIGQWSQNFRCPVLGWCDGQPLTAPARDDMGEARVGTKERLSDRTKKLMKEVRRRAETP